MPKRFLSKHFWTEGHGSLAVAVLIALTIRWALLEAYVIPSASMLPSLLIHDHIFVNKIVYGMRVPFTENWMFRINEPQRGEVIVFKYPKDMSIAYIKRIVGVPGDRIFYENGNLYVNDQLVERYPPSKYKDDFEWIADTPDDHGQLFKDTYTPYEEKVEERSYSIMLRKGERIGLDHGPYVVPKDNYFVLGDNRDNSQDSRYWRFVPRENLIGRASFVWLSCDEKLPGPFPLNVLCNPLEIRWKRFFHNVHR